MADQLTQRLPLRVMLDCLQLRPGSPDPRRPAPARAAELLRRQQGSLLAGGDAVAAALLSSRERVEYTVVGDTVNLAARLCDAARPAGSTVGSAATVSACPGTGDYQLLPALPVKGRAATVAAYRHPPAGPSGPGPGAVPAARAPAAAR